MGRDGLGQLPFAKAVACVAAAFGPRRTASVCRPLTQRRADRGSVAGHYLFRNMIEAPPVAPPFGPGMRPEPNCFGLKTTDHRAEKALSGPVDTESALTSPLPLVAPWARLSASDRATRLMRD